jgi:hypothetical protein
MKEHLSFTETGIELSAQERATFQRASVLAAQVRERARLIDPHFEDDDQDTLLAHIEHNAQEYANDGFIPIVEHDHCDYDEKGGLR